jgi:hypothetical protein
MRVDAGQRPVVLRQQMWHGGNTETAAPNPKFEAPNPKQIQSTKDQNGNTESRSIEKSQIAALKSPTLLSVT